VQDQDRDQKAAWLKTGTKNYETKTSMINSVARESKRNRYTLLSNIYYVIRIGYLK